MQIFCNHCKCFVDYARFESIDIHVDDKGAKIIALAVCEDCDNPDPDTRLENFETAKKANHVLNAQVMPDLTWPTTPQK